MNMREKIARAAYPLVAAAADFNDQGITSLEDALGDPDGNPWLDTSRQIADAVLDAMMEEPPLAVLEAGADKLFAAAHEDWTEDALMVWQAMLTAARSGA